jgi:iron-sulfur cluster assembly protein
MLTITEAARDMVRMIPTQPMLTATAGLRISRRKNQGDALNVQAENQPRKGDRVFDYDGARVFLGERAFTALENKMLDARLDKSGRVQFLLTSPA